MYGFLCKTKQKLLREKPSKMSFGSNCSLLLVPPPSKITYTADVMRTTFDPESQPRAMVGYAVFGYRFWPIENHKVIVARDVIFKEERKLNFSNYESDEEM